MAKSILLGRHKPLGEHRRERVDLLERGERIGLALRSKLGLRRLIVSPGHRLSIDPAAAQVLACCRGYRLPEPTWLADRLASRCGQDRRGEQGSCHSSQSR